MYGCTQLQNSRLQPPGYEDKQKKSFIMRWCRKPTKGTRYEFRVRYLWIEGKNWSLVYLIHRLAFTAYFPLHIAEYIDAKLFLNYLKYNCITYLIFISPYVQVFEKTSFSGIIGNQGRIRVRWFAERFYSNAVASLELKIDGCNLCPITVIRHNLHKIDGCN